MEAARKVVREAWGVPIAAKLDDLLCGRVAAELARETPPGPVTVLIHLPQLPIRPAARPDRGALRRELEHHAERSQAVLLRGLAPVAGGPSVVIDRLPLINVIVARLTSKQIKDLAARADVERIEIDKAVMPALHRTGPVLSSLPGPRATSLDGKGIMVAVIGGGVDGKHPDLAGRVVQKRVYDGQLAGSADLHETLMAGIVAGASDASGGRQAGVAPGATLWSYNVSLTEAAPGFSKAKAILDAATDGAHVILCGWRVVDQTPRDATCAWCKAADAAVRLGSVVVASVGNLGPGSGTATCPANAANVISVGATSADGKRMARSYFGAAFSSQGPTADGRMKPEVVAPGEGIQGPKAGGGYTSQESGNGTSFAAARVAGIAALLLHKDPSLTPDRVRRSVQEGARKIAGVPLGAQGAGLVDLAEALRRTGDLPGKTAARRAVIAAPGIRSRFVKGTR